MSWLVCAVLGVIVGFAAVLMIWSMDGICGGCALMIVGRLAAVGFLVGLAIDFIDFVSVSFDV